MTTGPAPDPIEAAATALRDVVVDLDQALGALVTVGAATEKARSERAAQAGILAGVREALAAEKRAHAATRAERDAALKLVNDLQNPSRFPGDPGPGNYLVGWALERGTASGWDLAEAMAQPWWNPKIALIHDYARSSAKLVDRVSIADIFAAGFVIASQSCKLGGIPGTWTEKCNAILAGTHNATIDSDAAWCKAHNKPIRLALYHEPENLTAAEAALLRAVTRYVALRFRAAGADNVVFQPVYQVPYTFELVSGKPRRDFRIWHPDWTGTGWHTDPVCALFGGDTYNPLPGGSASREFSKMWEDAWSVVKASGLPLVPRTNPEFGMGRTVPPDGWLAWAKRTQAYIRANNLVDLTYWDNSDDIGRYRLTDPAKLEAWNYLCEGAVDPAALRSQIPA